MRELIKQLTDGLRTEWASQPVGTAVAYGTVLTVLWNMWQAAPAVTSQLAVSDQISPLGGNIIVRTCVFFLLEGALASLFGRLFVIVRDQGIGFPWILTIVLALTSAWISYYNCFWIFVSNNESVEGSTASYIFAMFIAFILSWRFTYIHFDQKNKSYRENFIKTGAKKNDDVEYFTYGFYWAFWMTTAAFIFAVAVGIIEINQKFSII